MSRTGAGLVLAAAALLGCGGRPAARPAAAPIPLHLAPACDLVPAAGLQWIAAASPRAIAAVPDLIPAIARVVPEDRFRAFAEAHGGIDLRQVHELCVARYPETTLTVARVPLDPDRLAKAVDERSTQPLIRTSLAASPPVVRLRGDAQGGEPRQVLLFGREAVAEELGKPGPLRAVEGFAFGKLKRAAPALRSAALAPALARLEDAPLRVLAPGPFEGEAASGFGGLLRATTSLGLSARWAGTGAGVAVRLVLLGAWGSDAPAAAERLAAALHVLGESPPGRLFGLAHPLAGPTVRGEPDALVAEIVLDADVLARGVHDAVDAEVGEIMRR